MTIFKGFKNKKNAEKQKQNNTIINDSRDARTKAEDKAQSVAQNNSKADTNTPNESGGPKGLEPTRYGDWEKAGRCIDF